MKIHYKLLIKDWLPPVALRAVSKFRKPVIQFTGNYTSWEAASSECSGYNAKHILDKVLDATLKVKRGEAAFERDSVLFYKPEYVWSVLSGLMWTAARHNGRLNVLDFGGALGSSYFQHKVFFQDLPEVYWNIVEQEHYIQAGKKYIQDDQLRFYSSIDACLSENKINVVLLSSVLQYLPAPFTVLNQLSNCKASCLIIDRTPFFKQKKDYLVIQGTGKHIYEAKYPSWIFSEDSFNKRLQSNWSLLSLTPCPEGKMKTTAGIEFLFQGMLLVSKT